MRFPLAALSVVLAGGCAGAPRWSQFHADAQNEGFLGVHTRARLSAKWEVQVGAVAFASPVIGPSGLVYVGTLDGRILAVAPEGGSASIVFDFSRIFTRPTIFSSLAVDDAGNLFAVVTRLVPDPAIGQAYRSAIVSVAADGKLRWNVSWAGVFLTTSPKVVGSGASELVFITSARVDGPFLAAFDVNGRRVYDEYLSCPSDISGGVGTLPNPQFPQNWDANGPFPLLETPSQPSAYSDFEYWLDPTVAVIDSVRGAALPHPILVNSACAIQAMELDLGPPVRLRLLWVREKYQVYSSPAVSRNGQVVVGSGAGHVTAYDLQTGRPQWDFGAGQPVLATPAFFLGSGDVYVAAGSRLLVLDSSDGTPSHERTLSGPTVSSAALTWDGAYLSAIDGMHGFGFDLADAGLDPPGAGPRSSPAVGEDGTLYALTALGKLVAYAPP